MIRFQFGGSFGFKRTEKQAPYLKSHRKSQPVFFRRTDVRLSPFRKVRLQTKKDPIEIQFLSLGLVLVTYKQLYPRHANVKNLSGVFFVSNSEMTTASAIACFSGSNFAKPKSMIFAWFRFVMKIFAGLISRWIIPSECAASRASAICIAISKSFSDIKRLSFNQML